MEGLGHGFIFYFLLATYLGIFHLAACVILTRLCPSPVDAGIDFSSFYEHVHNPQVMEIVYMFLGHPRTLLATCCEGAKSMLSHSLLCVK